MRRRSEEKEGEGASQFSCHRVAKRTLDVCETGHSIRMAARPGSLPPPPPLVPPCQCQAVRPEAAAISCRMRLGRDSTVRILRPSSFAPLAWWSHLPESLLQSAVCLADLGLLHYCTLAFRGHDAPVHGSHIASGIA